MSNEMEMSNKIAALEYEIERLNATISVLDDDNLMEQIKESRQDCKPPRRLSEILAEEGLNEDAYEICHVGPDNRKDSIEVSRNAQEKYAWKIKQYHTQGSDALEAALYTISAIDARLREKYVKEAAL